MVVSGENGVGKTCLLNTVTSKTAGVINVKAKPKDDENTIIKNTLKHLILFFHFIVQNKSFSGTALDALPIIVINAAERKVGQDMLVLLVLR